MTREGSQMGMLHGLHAQGCNGTEYTACRPVLFDPPDQQGQDIEIVIMAWCGDCGAAGWDYV